MSEADDEAATLVVDDSVLFRRAVCEVLATFREVEVVGTAANGKLALARILELQPDLLVLDLEMPEMNGPDLLQALRERELDVDVIVLSAHTAAGSQLSVRALELGAFDFLTKPTSLNAEHSREAIRSGLWPMIAALAQRRELRLIWQGQGAGDPLPESVAEGESIPRTPRNDPGFVRPEMVVIGASTGGPNALLEVIPKLPADLNVPILIVQHMPPLFTQSLAENLDGRSAIRVREAQDREPLQPNTAYIAPGGRQMKVAASAAGTWLVRVTDDPPENSCKPSVDYLFRSVANTLPGRAMAVIMTGMGSDGVLGLRLMKRHGGLVIAQDQASSVVFGMPREAIRAGVVDVVAPLSSIAFEICKTVRGLPRD